MRVRYWCENCGAKPFNNPTQLFKHLKEEHEIKVIEPTFNYDWAGNKIWIVSCNTCSKKWKVTAHETDNKISIFPTEAKKILKKHKKTHRKYELDDKHFKCLRDLLCYIDRKYSIHIGYQKGIVNKVVFLDGIGKL